MFLFPNSQQFPNIHLVAIKLTSMNEHAIQVQLQQIVMFQPSLAWKLWLWLGLIWLWLSQTPDPAKAVNQGLALAWPGSGRSFYR